DRYLKEAESKVRLTLKQLDAERHKRQAQDRKREAAQEDTGPSISQMQEALEGLAGVYQQVRASREALETAPDRDPKTAVAADAGLVPPRAGDKTTPGPDLATQ